MKVYNNLLQQDFTADRPNQNQKWGTNFTYLFLKNGEVRYNCIILDLFDRSVVASITDRNITSDIAVRTLPKALDPHQVKVGLILHSDQGSQYTSLAFTGFCAAKGVTQIVSKAGYPYDSSPMERYFSTLKNEYTDLFDFLSEDSLYLTVQGFAYVTCTHLPHHSCNDYLTPWAGSLGTLIACSFLLTCLSDSFWTSVTILLEHYKWRKEFLLIR